MQFDELEEGVVQHPSRNKVAKLWEVCSGSGALSALARKKHIAHLPPIDLRFGWFTQRAPDQILLLYGILVVGVMCLFAAPNCALWGVRARTMNQTVLRERRQQEEPGLQFLALLCFLQFLMNRHFILENSGASQIFTASPLGSLQSFGLYFSNLDQCMYGAELEGRSIKKNMLFVSDVCLQDLDTTCDHRHHHLPLAGRGPEGS